MENIPRQFFTNEFKEEAVKLVFDGGLTVAESPRHLNIYSQTLKNWVTKNRAFGLTGPGSRSVSELEAEVSKLRKELAETRIERELLKRLWFPGQGASVRYAMIEELRSHHKYKLGVMCHALDLS